MKALVAPQPGGPEVLQLVERPDPVPGSTQLLVRVRAAGVNRPDVLQRRGHYPPPPGESDVLGLELAGEVLAAGERVPSKTPADPDPAAAPTGIRRVPGPANEGFAPGDRVFGLVAGGACAEFAILDWRMALPIPAGMSFTDAAAIPETFFTASENLFTNGRLATGETLLVHAAGSGVGIAALLLAREAGVRVFVTTRSAGKLDRLRTLGAEGGCDTAHVDFAEWIAQRTQGTGVDVILDFVGAPYWKRNIAALRPGGRLLLVGLLGGGRVEVDLGALMRGRISVVGSVLRARSLDEKIDVTRRFRQRWLPLVAAGRLRPVIEAVLPLAEAAEAHRRLESNATFGKIVLEI